MSYGPHTIIEQEAQRLLLRWVPKWHEAFYDRATGLFHERLAEIFRPVPMGYRRLLTQCRQLAIYSHASLQEGTGFFNPPLKDHFESLVRHFHVAKTGGWRFSVDDAGQPLDGTHDLYALSFVIFALGHYHRATGDGRARDFARETLVFIDRYFRSGALPGLVEALDEHLRPLPRMRRQNPHMHLLEACLFAADIWDDAVFRRVGDEMAGLFFRHFYDPRRSLLCEWFTDDLAPHPEKGGVVEPGHYFEWVWLLKKHAKQAGDPGRYDAVCDSLLAFANAHGWDADCGGIYDEIGADGRVVSDTKRIWPFTEALKANALMMDGQQPEERQARKARIAGMTDVFRLKYMEPRGFWTERLNRDLSPATDYMPGTTPYHVYFGIMETRDILRARGRGKSIIVPLYNALYRLRRKLSRAVRGARKNVVLRLQA